MKHKKVDPNVDFNEVIIGVDQQIEKDIKVELFNKSGKGQIISDPKRMTSADQEDAKKVTRPFKIKKVIALFKIKDTEGKLKTDFPKPLEIQVEYTPNAWNEALKNKKAKKKDRPRLAYLEWDNTKSPKWSGEWVEFTEADINAIIKPDPDGDPNGYIILSLKKLPDPAIGGC